MRYLLALAFLVLLAGCDQGAPINTDPSYQDDIQPIFTANCVGCHSGAVPSGDYDLSSRTGCLGDGSDTIANVLAGSADSSRLFQMLDQGLMPKNAPALDQAKIALVRNWINKGAKDN
jgi:mono/diheme cytochrome c family protein